MINEIIRINSNRIMTFSWSPCDGRTECRNCLKVDFFLKTAEGCFCVLLDWNIQKYCQHFVRWSNISNVSWETKLNWFLALPREAFPKKNFLLEIAQKGESQPLPKLFGPLLTWTIIIPKIGIFCHVCLVIFIIVIIIKIITNILGKVVGGKNVKSLVFYQIW